MTILSRTARAMLYAACLAGAASAAIAQGTAIQFGDGGTTSGQPVEVTADQLDFNQDAGTAVFTGNVLVVQGGLRLAADVVDVAYGPDAEGETEVQRLEATGGVTLVNGPDAAEAQRAIYTIGDGVLVMTGDVLLTRPDTALTGDTLRLNIDTGAGVMEGRVGITFAPEGDGG